MGPSALCTLILHGDLEVLYFLQQADSELSSLSALLTIQVHRKYAEHLLQLSLGLGKFLLQLGDGFATGSLLQPVERCRAGAGALHREGFFVRFLSIGALFH